MSAATTAAERRAELRAKSPAGRREAKQRDAILALSRAERRMVAAFTRWQKLRDTVRRYDRDADKRDAADLERIADARIERVMGRRP